MEISLGEYVLRDWRRDDAPSITTYANNRKIWLNLRDGFAHPYTCQGAEAFIDAFIGQDAGRNRCYGDGMS
jgi:hypothetical protein